ncbi:MAG: 23S rRNA (pseudouridine(1915)-N(3))-methyltransferase RlmH [Acidobacteria bacterium]|nr:MAG: 23S rRNA (pseudouridine(1915)-N(3))-methyltransferase RlmH [Acidobacteriota bacterium]REJ98930.1 MAG: 23S rRNA (pseudouridine(1915)-N(3))-methyltransferase RlmH [Acidobacteriota bacterium]REK16350.1 MAG: 23S rRNA (pseudouridine(1915)-N(3))-methyltransferase RlmH [Acidobacteriota bacterium]REK44031.1 MAG: 23S rRNA (pseudouridine(1915)-N(3))-methyltransferase RlmH [Acidobacteriota bacterium]
MKFHFIWVGKTKDPNWRALQEEYLQRLSHFVKYSISEIKDKAPHETVESEGERILSKVNQSGFVCVLDLKGRSLGSRKLAAQISKWQVTGIKEITFIIGGAEGLSPAVVERADFSLSLSFLTFTHDMARVILLEQLYRAFTIIKGFPYQK